VHKTSQVFAELVDGDDMNSLSTAASNAPVRLNTRSQFAHLHMAAPERSRSAKSKEKKWTAKELVAEASRLPGNARHVERPLPPVWLKGSGKEVLDRATAWHAQAREAGGKARRRRTSPSLACAVVSWPDSREGWDAYRDDVVDYFERTYGDECVAGVVEHRDESHLHVHLYLIARDDEGFGTVHPGYAARQRARLEPDNRVGKAFIEAMRRWQDDLYSATGPRHGLERMSVQRARWSRPEFNARRQEELGKKRADAIVAEAQERADRIQANAQELAQRVQQEYADQKKKRRDLVIQAEAVLAEREKFALEPAGVHAKRLQQATDEKLALEATVQRLRSELETMQVRDRLSRKAESQVEAGRPGSKQSAP
jgi:hypothetical protein